MYFLDTTSFTITEVDKNNSRFSVSVDILHVFARAYGFAFF
jgi:hypothetical protein